MKFTPGNTVRFTPEGRARGQSWIADPDEVGCVESTSGQSVTVRFKHGTAYTSANLIESADD